MNKRQSPPPLTLAQYNRIHNIVNSLAAHFANDIGKACVFFNITGAFLMSKIYKKKVSVVCGAASVVVHIGEVPNVLSWFKFDENGQPVSLPEAFHAWVYCDDWVIDFMAPNYEEAIRTSWTDLRSSIPSIPRNMLQKRMDDVLSLDAIERVGGAFFAGNQELTAEVIEHASERPATMDIANIAVHWHRTPEQPMPPFIQIQNDLGEIVTIPYIKRQLQGAW